MKIPQSIFFITGSSSGLGLATAHRLHSLGARVALLDRSANPSQVSELGSERAISCACDVRNEADIRGAIKMVDEKWPGGVVGGVVHAAGVGMAGKVSGPTGTRGEDGS